VVQFKMQDWIREFIGLQVIMVQIAVFCVQPVFKK